MNSKSKIEEFYNMVFNYNPKPEKLNYLIDVYEKNNYSMNKVEDAIRDSEDFNKLYQKLEKELEISEAYHSLLFREPDKEGLNYFMSQIIQNKKSIQWIENEIKKSKEYKSL